jgi:gamma-glutamyl-gamma-aminobutyrate hydrolase PuuD
MKVFFAAENDFEHVLLRELFARAYCSETDTIEDADLVVFGGGSDVSPELYGADKHVMSRTNRERDDRDIALYAKAVSIGAPMLGICRGAQLLHVMNGGKLFQHVTGHYGDHRIFDRQRKLSVSKVSSTHHQMCMSNPSSDIVVIADSFGQSGERQVNNGTKFDEKAFDIECFYYPSTGCLGIQGHPEYRGYHEFAKWALQLIEDTFITNPDFEMGKESTDRRRLKEDIRITRTKEIAEQVLKEIS